MSGHAEPRPLDRWSTNAPYRDATAALPRQPWRLASWWIVVGGGGFAGLFRIDDAWAAVPFALSGVMVGLAHGAGDWIDAGRRLRSPVSLARWWMLYGLAIAALAIAAFQLPYLMILAFLGLSMWHFGSADAYDLRVPSAHGRGERPTAFQADGWRWLAGTSRMSLFFGAMLAVSPARTVEIADGVAQMLSGRHGAPNSADLVARTGALLLIAGGIVWSLTMVHRRLKGDRAPGALCRLAVDVGETTTLTTLGATLDPLFATGLYFLGWHAPRHIALRIADDTVSARSRSGERSPQVRAAASWIVATVLFHKKTAMLWLPIIPVWATIVFFRGTPGQLESWTHALIALFAVLTPVHHALNERWYAEREFSPGATVLRQGLPVSAPSFDSCRPSMSLRQRET